MKALQEHVDLQPYNTLAIPARARFYALITQPEQLPPVLKFAHQHELPVLVLGGGSNLVLKGDYPGLVVHIKLIGKEKVREDDDYYWLKIAAGENWHSLVRYCLEHEYWGLENLSLIPGSVGAAPIQNIGAYGVELKDSFFELRAMDVHTGEVQTFDKTACEFGYRDSVFKNRLRDRFVILSVTLKLNRRPHLKVTYPSLREALEPIPIDQLSPQDVSNAVCRIRQSKLPDPATLPNVGSFFKNPVVDVSQFLELQVLHPGLVSYPVDSQHVKLAAGWLIERAGWKGVKWGGAQVHSEQALVLTNPEGGPGEDVLKLAEDIRTSINDEYGIDLESEPRIYP